MNLKAYPARYHKNIKRLCNMLCTQPETAYAMMLLTATLSDLRPDDEQVVTMILNDCGVNLETA